MEQTILTDYDQLDRYLKGAHIRRLLLVCGSSSQKLRIGGYFRELETRLGIGVVPFHDFTPNPRYPSVVQGVERFRQESCDAIAAIGGGSAMDVAKCVKLFCGMEEGTSYLDQPIVPAPVPLLAVPTTAGSGSEATRFAVIYRDGEKQSVSDPNAIPSAVFLDASALETLPEYQRKSTMLDALCHALESCWSVQATEESQAYACQAIRGVLQNAERYLHNDADGNRGMLLAANTAGKAIDLTQTTAGHAMCYKLTTLYGLAHGHAAALCVSRLWPYMAQGNGPYRLPDGQKRLEAAFRRIAQAMDCETVSEAIQAYQELLERLGLSVPVPQARDYAVLKRSVNPVRLNNNPVRLDEAALELLYHQIFENRG